MDKKLTRALGLLALAALAFVAIGRPAQAEFSDADWKEILSEFKRLSTTPLNGYTKQQLIIKIAGEGSKRSAILLVDWIGVSLDVQKKMQAEYDEKREDFEKFSSRIKDKDESGAPKNTNERITWNEKKAVWEEVKKRYEGEFLVQNELSNGLEKIKSGDGADWLAVEGMKRVKGSESAQIAVLRCLVNQPVEKVKSTILPYASDKKMAMARVIAINWIGDKKVVEGYQACVDGLQQEMTTLRAAVRSLQQLDKPECVKPLIDTLAKVSGLPAQEIDKVLQYFTGKTFQGDANLWSRWWIDAGEAWLRDKSKERPQVPPASNDGGGGGGASFYGITTKSDRIVFILDRSGSMESEVSDDMKQTGHISGQDNGKPEDQVKGNTKIEVARNQLKFTIERLASDTMFNVIFFNNDIEVWKAPPTLYLANQTNKDDAIKWFIDMPAAGSTNMFGAMMKSFEYCQVGAKEKGYKKTGADTIFLLSDGAPTDEGGNPLAADEIEVRYKAFLEKNKVYQCIVHTIGVGPNHSVQMMQRIAKDTGGQYKAVGMGKKK